MLHDPSIFREATAVNAALSLRQNQETPKAGTEPRVIHLFKQLARPSTDNVAPLSEDLADMGVDCWAFPKPFRHLQIEGKNMSVAKLQRICMTPDSDGLYLSAPGMHQALMHNMNAGLVSAWLRDYMQCDVTLVQSDANGQRRVSAQLPSRLVAG